MVNGLPLVAPGTSFQGPNTVGALCRRPVLGDQVTRTRVGEIRRIVRVGAGKNICGESFYFVVMVVRPALPHIGSVSKKRTDYQPEKHAR